MLFNSVKLLFQFQTELSSLLKTAEELKIKGLAEVSWRSDQEQSPTFNVSADESNISKKRKLDTSASTNLKKDFSEKLQVVIKMQLIFVASTIYALLINYRIMIWKKLM